MQSYPEPESILPPGTKIGGYTVESGLRAGGMGQVYRVTGGAGQVIALKLMKPGFGGVGEQEAFYREVSTMQSITHENLVKAHFLGIYEGRLYFTMDLMKGWLCRGQPAPSLEDYLARSVQNRLRDQVMIEEILIGILNGLKRVHDEQIIHCDIKPSNVLLNTEGMRDRRVVKLADFGLAQVNDYRWFTDHVAMVESRDPDETQWQADSEETVFVDPSASGASGAGNSVPGLRGTLSYMAPELIRGQMEPHEGSDIYSVGVLVYQMLTGDSKLGRESVAEINRTVDKAWDAFIEVATRRDPSQRCPSVEELMSLVPITRGQYPGGDFPGVSNPGIWPGTRPPGSYGDGLSRPPGWTPPGTYGGGGSRGPGDGSRGYAGTPFASVRPPQEPEIPGGPEKETPAETSGESPAEPAAPKRNSGWGVRLLMVFTVVGLLVAGGYFYRAEVEDFLLEQGVDLPEWARSDRTTPPLPGAAPPEAGPVAGGSDTPAEVVAGFAPPADSGAARLKALRIVNTSEEGRFEIVRADAPEQPLESGRTPRTVADLEAGTYLLRIQSGTEPGWEYRLALAPPQTRAGGTVAAEVLIRSHPTAMQVIDPASNAVLGTTPFRRADLMGSPRRFLISGSGYSDEEVALEIVPGSVNFIFASMEERTPEPVVETDPYADQVMRIDLGGGEGMEFLPTSEPGIWVGRFEVTNAQFRVFDDGHASGTYGSHDLDGPELPVVRVSAFDADNFVAWLNRTGKIPDGLRARLPSHAEWMLAVDNVSVYPWGNEWPPPIGNFADAAAAAAHFGDFVRTTIDGFDDGFAATSPVSDSGMNPGGFFGLAGNVAEWTRDSSGRLRIIVGGSWASYEEILLRTNARQPKQGSMRDPSVGFRIVLEPRTET